MTLDRTEAAKQLKLKFPDELSFLTEADLEYASWPDVFPSTSGPLGGIGDQTVMTSQIEAYFFINYGIVFCGDQVVKITDDFRILVKWR